MLISFRNFLNLLHYFIAFKSTHTNAIAFELLFQFCTIQAVDHLNFTLHFSAKWKQKFTGDTDEGILHRRFNKRVKFVYCHSTKTLLSGSRPLRMEETSLDVFVLK